MGVSLLALALAIGALPLRAMPAAALGSSNGTVGLSALGVTYSENFDGLALSGTSNTLPLGWAFDETGSNANTTYTAGTGSGTSGDTYSFGAASSGERAFGALFSGSLNPTIGVGFRNDTGALITALDVTYTGEQWRFGANARPADRSDFQLSTNATSLTDGTWTELNALDFTSPRFCASASCPPLVTGPLDGNLAANRTTMTATVVVNIAPGAIFWIRWSNFDAAPGSDDGLAVDDFFLTPRSSDAPPSVVSWTPSGAGATNVARNSNVTVGFSEPVAFSTANWFTISCTASGSHTAIVGPGGPAANVYSLNPEVDFDHSESCTVRVLAAQVSDTDGTPTPMTADHVFSFSTMAPPPPPTLIRDIQGASHTSPKVGLSVNNVNGIITAKRNNGFYMQDPAPDANDATSEAIFVFTSSAPAAYNVGDAVSVNGFVSEFRPGGSSSANLTITQLTSPSVTVMSSANPLPAAIVIGSVRTPPTQVIDDDAFATFDPLSDGIDFWESLEFMRLSVAGDVVGPRNDFGELIVVPDGVGGVRTSRGGIIVRPNDFNPERLMIDDLITATPSVSVGQRITSAVGVLEYDFSNFKLAITQAASVAGAAAPRETAASPAGDQLVVSTFNVENLDAAEPQIKFDLIASYIVNNLNAPDLLSLEEVQDNNGATNDSVVDATLTLQKLRNSITAAGGPTYEWRLIDPVDDQDGGEPGGNIRSVFFFRTDRGLAFVDRPGGTSTNDTTVIASRTGPQLSYSPGRLQASPAAADAFNSSRKPLVGEFTYNGYTFFAVANHFNSKGGDNPLFGRFQPPVRTSEAQRHKQATIVADHVSALRAVDPTAKVVVLGDLNDFAFSTTLGIIEAAGMVNPLNDLPESERYSYVFEGNSQSLDHIMVSSALASRTTLDVVHINSEYHDQASDHDPIVAFIDLADTTDPTIAFQGNQGTYELDETVDITCTATDDASGIDDLTCEGGSGTAASFGPGTHTVTATATDGSGNMTIATTTFTVIATFDSLTEVVESIVDHDGLANSLNAKLRAAQRAVDRGDNETASNILDAFINEVEAQRGKKISDADADALIAAAQAL